MQDHWLIYPLVRGGGGMQQYGGGMGFLYMMYGRVGKQELRQRRPQTLVGVNKGAGARRPSRPRSSRET